MRCGYHHLILFGRLLQIGLEKTKKALLLLLHQCGYTSIWRHSRGRLCHTSFV